MGILDWMKGNTDWGKGQKEFSSGKGQKKTTERIEGFMKEGKLNPGRARGSRGRRSDKRCGEGLEGAGCGEQKCKLLVVSSWGSGWPEIAILQLILSLLLPSTLQGNNSFNASSFKTNVLHFFQNQCCLD